MKLVVVDGDEDRAVVTQKLAQQLQAGEHHAAPLVVAGEVLAVHDLAQPVLHHGGVDVVVVGPALVAGVVGRVDVDALDLAVIRRQQRLQGGQVVALDDQVVVQARLPAQPPGPDRLHLVERNRQMVVLHEHPSLELQPRHVRHSPHQRAPGAAPSRPEYRRRPTGATSPGSPCRWLRKKRTYPAKRGTRVCSQGDLFGTRDGRYASFPPLAGQRHRMTRRPACRPRARRRRHRAQVRGRHHRAARLPGSGVW